MVDWSKTWTWLDGKWLEGNVPIMGPRTHSFWLGSSVFDGARYFEGVAPDLDLHCARINRSAKAIGMAPTMEVPEMVRLALEGCAKFPGDVALYIRPNYWSEDGGFMGVPPDPNTTRFALCIYEEAMPGFEGFSATTTKFRRPLPETAVVNAKAGCLYPNGGRAMNEAKEKGFQNAVLTDALGNVCELATANLFIVKDGIVKTPSATGVYLAGITRARLIGLLKADGYDVREASLKIEDLYEADEFFASGNYGKVTPVNRFEDKLFEPGPVTKRARDLYWKFAHGK